MDKLPVITDIAILARKQRILLGQFNSISAGDIGDKLLEEEFINNRLKLEDILTSMDSLIEVLVNRYVTNIQSTQ
jgi:hypothetical protein